MKAHVAVISMGKRQVHMGNNGLSDYVTACGLDGSDGHPDVQQETVAVEKGEKINCRDCWKIWQSAREYRRADFAKNIEEIEQ